VEGILGLRECGFWWKWLSVSDLGVGCDVGGCVNENVGGW
jgi:hypothetical protein